MNTVLPTALPASSAPDSSRNLLQPLPWQVGGMRVPEGQPREEEGAAAAARHPDLGFGQCQLLG